MPNTCIADPSPERQSSGHTPAGASPRDEDLSRRILETIADLTAHTGRPPTYREVLARLGLTSHRRLSEGLDDLVRTGHLHRLTGSRNLILAAEPVSVEST